MTETYFTATGNILHYSYTAKNNGFAPLLGPVTITDDKVGTVSCQAVTAVGDLDAYLDVNETVICPATGTADYTVTGANVTSKLVTNTAHATAGGVNSPNVSKTVPLAPDLTLAKANDTNNTVVLGNTYKWTLTVNNGASAGGATFTSGQTLLTDNLPTSGATYSLGTVSVAGGTSGPINCSIVTNTLTCVAGATDVTIPSGASFSVPITVTPTATGSLANPRAAGICKVDPTPSVAEIDDTNNNCASNTVAVTKATPSLTTTASGPVAIGSNITDTAHLSGGYGALSGTITFDVFAPGDTTCATPLTAPSGKTVTGAGDYPSGNFASTTVGGYRWIAHYSGDANNLNVNTACNDANETSTVTKATPSLTTTASGPAIVGGNITDTAHLSGGYGTLSGTITFDVFAPGDTTCATPLTAPSGATVNGAGDYPSGNFASTTVGGYRWIAHYSGNANNLNVNTACNDANETSTVNKASPTITTQLKLVSNNSNLTNPILTGTALYDTATFASSYNASGTVTYNVYSNNTCATLVQNVNPAPNTVAAGVIPNSANYTFNTAGNFWYQAVYSGDVNNNSATSICTSEPVVVTNVASVDLSLAKVVNDASPKLGDAVIFTITVTNHSLTAAATTIVIHDALPNGLTFNSSTPSIGAYSNVTGNWTIATLSANTSATLQLNVTVTQIGAIANTAEITASDQPDPDSTVNNHAPAEDDQSSVSLGSVFDPPSGIKVFNDAGLPELEFRLGWINSGNASSINTQVTDNIPAGTTYVSGSVACAPQGSSSNAVAATAPLNTAVANSYCAFDPLNNRIQWQGSIGPDNGNLTEATAANEVVITFRVDVSSLTNEVNNTSASRTDTDGDADFTDENVVGDSLINSNAVVWARDLTLPDQLPKTGFAPNVITSLPEQPSSKLYTASAVWIEIPSLGVNIPIVGVPLIDKEWDVSWLWKQAGWLNGTAFPGWSGNSVLTSHVTLPNGKVGPFAQLGKLKWGDRIIIHSYGSVYTYEVRENRTISPNNTSVLKHEEEAWLTLITCKTFNEKTETYSNRIAVRAVLIKVALEK